MYNLYKTKEVILLNQMKRILDKVLKSSKMASKDFNVQ